MYVGRRPCIRSVGRDLLGILLYDLLVDVSKPRFVELGLGLLEAHGLEGFPDEAAVLLAGVSLEGRVQSVRVPGLALSSLGLTI